VSFNACSSDNGKIASGPEKKISWYTNDYKSAITVTYMSPQSGWRIFVGPFVLLILIYLVWFIRYPTWRWFESVEQLFLMLISSYLAVLLLSMVFLKKEARKSLSQVFKIHGYSTVILGTVVAFLFQAIWLLISWGIAGEFEFISFPSLKGYESYTVQSMFFGSILYLAFAVFGAFAEEITFRGYIQSRIASRYGCAVGIFTASLFFSLEHIHIFEISWVERFFQTQFVYVFCFGIFVGYLFFKSREDIWGVFAFHAFANIFDVLLPIRVTFVVPLGNQFVTIMSFTLMILLLRSWFSRGVQTRGT